MEDKIPNKVHFVWLGQQIPVKQAKCVLSWAEKTPTHEIVLWTDDPTANARALSAIRGEAMAKKVRVKDYRTVERPKIGPISTEVLFLKELQARNYGAASDILRILVLRQEGGIYTDTDSVAEKPLPTDMRAPRGIRFGTHKKTGQNKAFCNAIIAAPKGRCLDEIAAAMCMSYQDWVTTGSLEPYRKAVVEARRKVEEARQQSRSRGGTDIELSDEVKEAKANLQQHMMHGTVNLTGPSQIATWLYLTAIPNPTPLTEYVQEKAKEIKIDPTKMNHIEKSYLLEMYHKNVVSPAINTDAVIKDYGFPDEYATIESEGSWIS